VIENHYRQSRKESEKAMTHLPPAIYEIRIAESLGSTLSQRFEGFTIRPESEETILSARIVDQSALYGVLIQLRDLGLSLLSVNRIEKPTE
jgi:hypothetical protein